MRLGRLLALPALAIALLVVGFLALRGGGGETYKLRFQNAGQLVKDDDVQVGGRRIGSIQDISLTNDGQAEVGIRIDPDFGALHRGTTATIRATSLSGVANRYIALTPAPQTNPKLPEGALLGTDSTTSIVDLDQLFNTFTPKAREGLRRVIEGSSTIYKGKEAQANEAFKQLAPALASSDKLVTQLGRDQKVLTEFLVNSSRATGAIAERKDDLTNLVTNTNRAFAAIGSEDAALGRALGLLPDTLRRGSTTFVNLRATVEDLDELTDASKPATRRLAPFLRALRPLVADARPTIADLRSLIRRPGAQNDLVEATRQLPELERVSRPALRNSRAALNGLAPVLEFARPYATELEGWIRGFGQSAAAYDANGHYARVAPVFNALRYTETEDGPRAVPNLTNNRLAGLSFGNLRRCPGAFSAPPPDRSAPNTDGGDLDCDPTQTPPGP